MAVRRPTIQSLLSANYETDESGDEQSHRTARHQQTYPRPQQQQQPSYQQHVNPQQLVKHAMNEDGESKIRTDDGAGSANGKGDGSLKGPKRGARACTNCEWNAIRCR
jgi:hypothetical protein